MPRCGRSQERSKDLRTRILGGRISTSGRVDAGSAERNSLTNRARKNFATGPVAEVEGTTLAFSKAQPSKLLKVPAEDTITSLRDRADRSVCRSGRVQGHHLRNQRLMQSLTSAVNRSGFSGGGIA